MSASNVPLVTWNPAVGFIAPPEVGVVAGVFADINSAFGGNLSVTLAAPQGQLSTSEGAVISDYYDQFVFYTTQTDPASATGRMQDAIGRISPGGDFARLPAQSTSVVVACAGANGTNIPAGATIIDVNGNPVAAISGGHIDISGTVNILFAYVQTGPIACPIGALSSSNGAHIYTTIGGWDSISNAADGTVGTNAESASAFEARRQASVALNAVGLTGAVKGAVLSVPGVTDAYVYDNSEDSPQTVLGVTIAANSLYVCASGGAAQAICQAIWTKKSNGCSYTGSTSETVYDPTYAAPQPSYTVSYQQSASLEFVFAIVLESAANPPSNAVALVQAAILAAFAGTPIVSRATIGSLVLAAQYYPAIQALGPWAQIKSFFIGSANATAATFTGAIAGTALTVSSVSGTIAIGQTVQGAGVLNGTTIVSGSGTSWVVSASQTVASEAMVAVSAALTAVQVQANQQPTLTAADISVTAT